MNTKTIEDFFQNIKNVFLDEYYEHQACDHYPMCIVESKTLKEKLNNLTYSLLTAFAEEVIGNDESEEDVYEQYTNISEADFNRRRNNLREEQRLKVKELLSNLK